MKTSWYKKLWDTPWLRNTTIGVGVILLTIIGFFGQKYADWLGASLVGVPSCVQDSGQIVVFPVAGVVNSITKSEITKAIEERKISSLHGKHYSNKADQLKATYQKIMRATNRQELTAVQTSEYQAGGHIGIDIPVWWHEDKENVPVLAPFTQAQVYRTFKVSEGSNTWGNGVTLCYSNEHGTYFAHFAHLKNEPTVTEGQVIKAGEQIGIVGNTGNSYGAHLHFQVNKYAKNNPYYTSDATVMRTTFIDPLLLASNVQLAYGGNVLVAGPTPTTPTTNLSTASIINLNLTPAKNEAAVGDKVQVTVEAKDEKGNPASGKILIASSVPVGLPTEKQITNGSGQLEISSAQAQDVKVTVSDENGKVKKDVTIAFKAEEPNTETTDNTSNTAETVNTQSNNVSDIFTDIANVPSSEKNAIQYLWDNKITTGCSGDKFCPNDSLNRAAAATFLIRAFYSQIDLSKVSIGAMPFSDVDVSAWYAPAIYVANLSNYNGTEKPVFIKGSNGKAMPASDVKLEEFSAMILRVLKVEVLETDPWYTGYNDKMNKLGLISQSEVNGYLGKSIPRKMVARIIHQAVLWHKSNPNGLALTAAEKAPTETAITEETVVEEEVITIDPPQDLQIRTNSNGQIILEWLSSATPNTGYNVYRKTSSGDYELITSKLTTPQHMDFDAISGNSYTYKVEAEDLNTGEKSPASNEASIQA